METPHQSEEEVHDPVEAPALKVDDESDKESLLQNLK